MAVALGACSGDSPISSATDGASTGPDFDALLQPPTVAERQAVLAEWSVPPLNDVITEWLDTVQIASQPVVVRVVSHLVEGDRHMGAIAYPLGLDTPLPALLYCHFDVEGVQFESAVLILTAVAGLRGDQFVYVIPSYRGQSLQLGTRRFSSTGERSPWDGEVDDALGLLQVAWSMPETQDGQAAALGLSAGATVAMLAAVRQPGIAAVVDYFGPSDFFGDYSEGMLRRIVDGDTPQIRRIPLVAEQLILPWAEGLISTPEMRLALLRRSPAYFADHLPPILAHHGTADEIVDIGETTRLQAAVDAVGGQMESWTYAGVGHSPFGMRGALGRTAQFLATLP